MATAQKYTEQIIHSEPRPQATTTAEQSQISARKCFIVLQ